VIHNTAIIDAHASLGKNVTVGPYSVIGADVSIGDNTWIGPHVVIKGPTSIGQDNKIYQFASLGEDSQDKKYSGEKTTLTIGDRNIIREFCTFNRGTVQGGGTTAIGNDNWIMAYAHIAHDCRVGNHTTFSNNATLAGHVVVDDYALMSGFSAAHQFCQIGAHAMVGMGTLIAKDVPPYVIVSGPPATPYGINYVGLKRRGFSESALAGLKQAYKIIYRQGLTRNEALVELAALANKTSEVSLLVEFLNRSERGIVR